MGLSKAMLIHSQKYGSIQDVLMMITTILGFPVQKVFGKFVPFALH